MRSRQGGVAPIARVRLSPTFLATWYSSRHRHRRERHKAIANDGERERLDVRRRGKHNRIASVHRDAPAVIRV